MPVMTVIAPTWLKQSKGETAREGKATAGDQGKWKRRDALIKASSSMTDGPDDI